MSRNLRRRAVSVLVLAGLAAAGGLAASVPGADRGGLLVEVERRSFPFPEASGPVAAPRVDRPYFERDGRLQWDGSLVHTRATGACDTRPAQRDSRGAPLYPRTVRMLAPRVDERRCPRGGERPGTETALIGIDEHGEPVWQRDLAFPSGEARLARYLVGAGPQGLVLSDLEVWSPDTGETLVPARTHPVGAERRPVPDHEVHGAALYHPGRGAFYLFDADVTLLRRQGGLHRFDPRTGERELLVPVSSTLLGGFDQVEEMALSGDGRLLLLAQRLAVRGATSVSLAVVDLDRGARVFFERHGEGHGCADPRVVAGPGGRVGFAYRDDSDRRHVLVLYRQAAPGGR